MNNPVISLSLDDRIARVFAEKLAEVEAAEDKLAKMKSATEASQKNFGLVSNAAISGQGSFDPVGLAFGVKFQRETEFNKFQEHVAKLNNDLNAMRKTFHVEAERAALAAIKK